MRDLRKGILPSFTQVEIENQILSFEALLDVLEDGDIDSAIEWTKAVIACQKKNLAKVRQSPFLS